MALPPGQTNVGLDLAEVWLLREALDLWIAGGVDDERLQAIGALDAKLDKAELRAERLLSE